MTVKLWNILETFKQDNRRMVLISCPDCGAEYKIRATAYRDKRGCRVCRFKVMNRGNLGKHRGIGDLTRTYYNHFKGTARRRSVPFTVGIEELWKKAERQDMKCALSGLPLKFPTMRNLLTVAPYFGDLTENEKQYVRVGSGDLLAASLDRINSSGSYRKGNVQWLNKSINIMKNGFTQEEFVYYCHLVASNNPCPKAPKLRGNRKKKG